MQLLPQLLLVRINIYCCIPSVHMQRKNKHGGGTQQCPSCEKRTENEFLSTRSLDHGACVRKTFVRGWSVVILQRRPRLLFIEYVDLSTCAIPPHFKFSSFLLYFELFCSFIISFLFWYCRVLRSSDGDEATEERVGGRLSPG